MNRQFRRLETTLRVFLIALAALLIAPSGSSQTRSGASVDLFAVNGDLAPGRAQPVLKAM